MRVFTRRRFRAPKQITNDRLRSRDVPAPSTEWEVINRFAMTFHGYDEYGSFEALSEMANQRAPATLTELRGCLFFEARRFHHFGHAPTGDDLEYIRTLVRRIGEQVGS